MATTLSGHCSSYSKSHFRAPAHCAIFSTTVYAEERPRTWVLRTVEIQTRGNVNLSEWSKHHSSIVIVSIAVNSGQWRHEAAFLEMSQKLAIGSAFEMLEKYGSVCYMGFGLCRFFFVLKMWIVRSSYPDIQMTDVLENHRIDKADFQRSLASK